MDTFERALSWAVDPLFHVWHFLVGWIVYIDAHRTLSLAVLVLGFGAGWCARGMREDGRKEKAPRPRSGTIRVRLRHKKIAPTSPDPEESELEC